MTDYQALHGAPPAVFEALLAEHEAGMTHKELAETAETVLKEWRESDG